MLMKLTLGVNLANISRNAFCTKVLIKAFFSTLQFMSISFFWWKIDGKKAGSKMLVKLTTEGLNLLFFYIRIVNKS